MVKPWFPLALVGCLAGCFALWYSMDDYERARYFGLIVGVPVTTFAILGLVGVEGG